MAEDEPCALYRHFDSDGVLLYVGITSDPLSRTQGHIRSSIWVRTAATGTVQWFPTRSGAESAERRAILDERPLFNAMHSLVAEQERVDYFTRRGVPDPRMHPDRTGFSWLDRQPVDAIATPSQRVSGEKGRVHVVRWQRGPTSYKGREVWSVFSACGRTSALATYHTLTFVADETPVTCKACAKVPGVNR